MKRRPRLTAAEVRFLIEYLNPFRVDEKGWWDRISNRWVYPTEVREKLGRMEPKPTITQRRRLALEAESLARFERRRLAMAPAATSPE